MRLDPMLAGDGFAVAGISLGVIGILFGLFFLLLLVAI
jgi:hypothetical protein